MPSVTSIVLHRRRGPSASTTGPRRPARRSAGSTPSPRRAASATDSVLATHSRPGSQGRVRRARRPPARTTRRRRRRRRAAARSASPASTPCRSSQAASAVLAVGAGPAGPAPPVRGSSSRRSASSARELRGRDVAARRAGRSDDSSVRHGAVERVDRAGGGRGRVVDLVREPGGQRAERDQRLALPRGRLDRAGGAGTAPRSGARRTGTRRRPARAARRPARRSTRPSATPRPVAR